ncbi:hypothetical protein C6501_18375 [Candidatus Poribacteria bacterium]|nr:MAG: hypothetical protein C6501_18375 [Candidatus Poribacteria bacterium]
MHIKFFLEEPSAEVTLRHILPKILLPDIICIFHAFEGKDDMLEELPKLMKGHQWIPDNWRIIVLIDEDRKDCHELKAYLEKAAHDAGFVTKSSAAPDENFQVVNRIAIEELEAWFFGDVEALHAAYPRISKNLQAQAKYRYPDAIRGGTYEALERLLKQARYYKSYLPKREVAQNIAQHMEPSRNRSKSFQVFVEGLKACVGEESLV